jgi:hypothetical protein
MRRLSLEELQGLTRLGGVLAKQARQEILKRTSGATRGGRKGGKRRKDPEGDQQRAYLARLEAELPQVRAHTFAVPNERISPGMGGRLKALGASSGVMDLLCILPPPSGLWRGMALEFKAPGREGERDGGRSPAQVEWAERFIFCGWFYRVVYTADSAMLAAHECYSGGGF